jgi:hypothetical protein
MQKNISVLFQLHGSDLPVVISYNINMSGDIQTISCVVDNSEHRNWLQLNKFELRSQLAEGMYVALYNEAMQKKNIATTLFIDQVYSDIMHYEKKQMSEELYS